MLLLALFSGPASRVDALISAFAAVGMPAAVDRTNGQPNTRFHALDHPRRTNEELVIALLGSIFGGPIPDPAPQTKTDRDGEPVWDENTGELEVEVLCPDADDAVTVAGPHGFRLRMHGDSGFSTMRQAEAVAAARLLPPKHPLVEQLENDPQLRATLGELFGEAGT